MTVREGALDLEVLVKIDQPPAGEHRADHVDDLDREVREVPEVLVPDLPALAVGAAQQVGRVHHSVLTFCIDYGYVSRTSTFRHSNNITPLSDRSPVITLATPNRRKEGPTPINTGDRASDPQKLPAKGVVGQTMAHQSVEATIGTPVDTAARAVARSPWPPCAHSPMTPIGAMNTGTRRSWP